MSSVALSERLRKLKSELKRSGAPMESIDIALLTAILCGLPHTKKQLHQLEHGLRAAFEKAGLRIRYNATEHEQTLDTHLRAAQEPAPTPTLAEAEVWAMGSNQLTHTLLWPRSDFVPLMDKDEDDRTVLDSRLDSTGTPFRAQFTLKSSSSSESLVVRRRVARDRQLEAILRLRAANPEEFRRRHFEMMAIETQEGE
ncbi:hypothetical protein PR002_g30450 [Phytophthora rubi]|uniref:Uncharacterized protein n=1 Tax=Phytophthora rubi TaxID=129364 RepID=A0A6A3GR80_9STRA|nr:hypothetical protein PR002_g30450 [Phytophthora rubi]